MEPQSKLLKINKNEYLAQQKSKLEDALEMGLTCLLYTSPSPRDRTRSRMPSSA